MMALKSMAKLVLMLWVALPAAAVESFNITIADCFTSFATLNLDLQDFSRYTEFFHEGSTLQLAQAGVYTGPVAIEEYLKFANVQNPAIDGRVDLNQTFALTKVDTEVGVCEFVLNTYTKFGYSELFSNATVHAASAYRLFLNVSSGQLDKVNALVEEGFIHWVAAMLSLPNAQAWVCNLMEHSCGETWSFNGLVDQPECLARLAALPSTTGERGAFDGNSQSCRFLHAVLAEFNDDHCPHISFMPQEDKKGEFKCQESQNVSSSDLFTTEQLALFDTFKSDNGLPASGFIPTVPCGASNHQPCPERYTCDTGAGFCLAHDEGSSSTTTTSTSAITAADCFASFATLNLDLQDFSRYTEFFHEGSTLQLAQAGVYTGPAAIEEYLKFANVQNPAIDGRVDLNQTFALTKVDTEVGVCEFVLNTYTKFGYSELFSNATVDAASAYRLFLNVSSGQLDKVNALVEEGFIHWVAAMLSLPNAQAWVCNLMEHSCGETWSFNGLVDQPECLARLAALPSTTGESGAFDGNSQSCRFLHAVLAEFNDDHCPHISFMPQEDKKGEFKCQESQNVSSSDLFTTEQLALFDTFKSDNGLPASGFIPTVPCGASNHQPCPERYTCDTGAGFCVAHDEVSSSTTTTSTSATARDAGTGSASSAAPSTSAAASHTTITAAPETSTTTSYYESDGSSTAALATGSVIMVLAAAFGSYW